MLLYSYFLSFYLTFIFIISHSYLVTTIHFHISDDPNFLNFIVYSITNVPMGFFLS